MYMFGCFSIMIFNAVIIYRKKVDSKAMKKNTARWVKIIQQCSVPQLDVVALPKICNASSIYRQDLQHLMRNGSRTDNISIINKKNKKHLLKSLKNVAKLIAFSNALNHVRRENSDGYDRYMDMLMESEVFRTLALVYKKKKSEERAYFAYFVYQHPSVAKNAEGICKNIIDTMITFMVASNIYCRVNVFKALCRVGDANGIMNALQFFSDKSVFVHHKLLAEDLYDFAGDKDALAIQLWERHNIWNGNIMLGIISFIAMFSDGFRAAFLPVLESPSVSMDIRIEIIRYYKKYSFLPAQPILVEYLSQTENYDIANEAASALCAYPGFNTTRALVSALQSENWYVQYNAASSLVELGEYMGETGDRLPGDDSDVVQIIEYKVAHANEEKYINESGVIV